MGGFKNGIHVRKVQVSAKAIAIFYSLTSNAELQSAFTGGS
jgi:hypothetical protein